MGEWDASIKGLRKIPAHIIVYLAALVLFITAAILAFHEAPIVVIVAFGIFGLIVVAGGIWVTIQLERKRLSSERWFEIIAEKLDDCSSARIYLRDFSHPDDFKDKHRRSLMRIMQCIRTRLEGGADLKIIAYHPNSKASALDWLKGSMARNAQALTLHVKMIRNQPVGNATTAYIFDDKTIVYNKKSDGQFTYHADDLSNSVLFALIFEGFSSMEKIL